MANQGGDVRAASLVGPQVSATASASGLKLPLLLTARPGNVGVQIDAHRTMNVFSHPRSVKFTTQFHGLMYENGSLENYSRVVERTAQRARLVQDKLEKLRAREQHLLEDEEKRKQRRVQREAARQRRMWQMHQAVKRADDRARENTAAVTMQKVIRGTLARRVTRMLRQARATHEAASMLQRMIKTHVSRQQLARERERRSREEEERREFEMHSAAEVLQRQARKRLKVVQTARQQAALAVCTEYEDEHEEDTISKPFEQTSLEGDLLSDEKIIADALSRGISLDLLFSDEEDVESATNSTSSSSVASVEDKPPVVSALRILPQPPPSNATAVRRPRRPMSIKRVGGGYRTKLLPYNAIDSCPTKEYPSPATIRTSHGRTWQQERRASSSDINDDFLCHPRRPSTIPTAASSPTLLASTSKHPTTPQKSDNDEVRAASPIKTSPPKVSPYAIPLCLLPSR
ncbi:hypothetical protein KRP22_003902 [Phytophthora ramorum]|uniref:uncharacterized protein n=1 Tax=Phytophthora ramorum TaxID=164328 RepID=UPI0030B4FF2E|nr:hypothetical protein KRP23_8546 [Phytophthora ramorum]KAH7500587.1 hypothetical protein KRP22_9835 [Phytophthora ramorum]